MLVLALLHAGDFEMLGGQVHEGCKPAKQTDAQALLRAAAESLGWRNLGESVLHLRLTDATLEDYQSDRSYPPFFLAFIATESWYRPTTGVAHYRSRISFPHSESDLPDMVSGSKATFQVQDTATRAAPGSHGSALILRALDPWAQLFDWMATERVTVVGLCEVRDYPRTVLERTGPYGKERLALDPKTALPVSLAREEPHYLWGQVSVEYVYSNWRLEGGFSYPGTSFRMVDGSAQVSRTVSVSEPAGSRSAPSLELPDTTVVMTPAVSGFLRPSPLEPATIGTYTRLLVNPGYTEAVVLLGDTIYLLDATQGEERAEADAALIARLFPGRHPVVLVVTDLAWPHLAGLRYWVAHGATIVSHRSSRPFLERVLQRRWTRTPDIYERQRRANGLMFRGVDDSLSLAGGKLRLFAIDGPSSEGGLMGYIEGDRFLWSGDYIQTVQQPSTYLLEVWQATRRVGIRPSWAAAQHLPLTQWTTIDSVARHTRPSGAW